MERLAKILRPRFTLVRGGVSEMSESEKATVAHSEREHIRAQRKMLRLLQWAGGPGPIGTYCPVCKEHRPDHRDACDLAALVAVDFDGLPEPRE